MDGPDVLTVFLIDSNKNFVKEISVGTEKDVFMIFGSIG